MLAEILKSQYNQTIEGERIIRVGGTVPWWVKYSNYGTIGGKHTPADTVEEFVSTMSAFNGLIDGGAYPFTALANASLYQHYPLQERYFQNPVPPQIPLENKNYLLFIIGDFHSSSLLYQAIPTLWNDLTRGEMPLALGDIPLMSERVPHVLDYLYRTKSENDYFVSGTAVAGLCYPNRFAPREHSELADGIDFWQKSPMNCIRNLICALQSLRTWIGIRKGWHCLKNVSGAIPHPVTSGVETSSPWAVSGAGNCTIYSGNGNFPSGCWM